MKDGQKAWTWCHAFCQSDLPPTTKHVLHTLHMFMNALGESCFPSVEDLVEYSGLSKRAVLQHLQVARDAGWIESRQHGFRGRKWRRQEYLARWPERDLTASSPPEKECKKPRGGAGYAPRHENEVVQEIPQGGARPASEVVHEGNRVIENNPITNPSTNPIERERVPGCASAGECESGLAQKTEDLETVTRDTWIARFRRAHKDWPTFATDSVDTAQAAWFDLSEADRAKAAELLPAFVAHATTLGRSKFCAFSKYLQEKRWERLPDTALKARAGVSSLAAPYGRDWGALRFADLMRPAYGRIPPATRFQQQLISQGGAAAEGVIRERTAQYGWPKVSTLHEDALRRHRGAPSDPRLAGLADLFGKVKVGGDYFAAWKALHHARGWPFLGEARDLPEWIYMPAPDQPSDAYASAADAVKAAMARFENAHAELQKNEAAE
jgi:DNA-binding transcriptional ArsR family regulator